MSKQVEKTIYDFEVFKALVEIEIERIKRYGRSKSFAIAFLYAPNLAKHFKDKALRENEIAFVIKGNIRSADVVSSVEDDFIFLFYPDTDKQGAQKSLNRIKNKFDFEIIDGVADYPSDGDTARDLFTKLVVVMNEKLIPVIELDLE